MSENSNIMSTDTRTMMSMILNKLADNERAIVGCPAPKGVFEQHSQLLDKINSNVVQLDKNVSLLTAEVTAGNNDVKELFEIAKANQKRIQEHADELLVIKTEKKTVVALIVAIFAGISAIGSVAFSIFQHFHKP